jgi:hypothetical protein
MTLEEEKEEKETLFEDVVSLYRCIREEECIVSR